MPTAKIYVQSPNYSLTLRQPRYTMNLARGTQGPPGEADKRMAGRCFRPNCWFVPAGNTKAFIRIPIELNGIGSCQSALPLYGGKFGL